MVYRIQWDIFNLLHYFASCHQTALLKCEIHLVTILVDDNQLI